MVRSKYYQTPSKPQFIDYEIRPKMSIVLILSHNLGKHLAKRSMEVVQSIIPQSVGQPVVAESGERLLTMLAETQEIDLATKFGQRILMLKA